LMKSSKNSAKPWINTSPKRLVSAIQTIKGRLIWAAFFVQKN